MNFHIMTLFPEMVDYVLSQSIIGRAKGAGIISVKTYNIRDYANNKHNKVDDTPYGGGMGMLMAAPPVCDCFDAVCRGAHLPTICQQGQVRCQHQPENQ